MTTKSFISLVLILTSLSGCISDSVEEADAPITESPDNSITVGAPDNITRSGTWVLSIPSFSASNALREEIDVKIPIDVTMLIEVAQPAVLDYEVWDVTGQRETIRFEQSDLTTSWEVYFELVPGQYEIWPAMRTGAQNDFVVEIRFDAREGS
jgi:hypothetical protein